MAKEPLPGHELPHPPKLPLDDYERELRSLQIELVKAQYWVKDKGERILLIFEGRDTAGKGGTIARFKEHVNPRGAPHVALSAPTETSGPSCTSIATSSTFRREARSSSSTGPGTTGWAWSRSWASAPWSSP